MDLSTRTQNSSCNKSAIKVPEKDNLTEYIWEFYEKVV